MFTHYFGSDHYVYTTLFWFWLLCLHNTLGSDYYVYTLSWFWLLCLHIILVLITMFTRHTWFWLLCLHTIRGSDYYVYTPCLVLTMFTHYFGCDYYVYTPYLVLITMFTHHTWFWLLCLHIILVLVTVYTPYFGSDYYVYTPYLVLTTMFTHHTWFWFWSLCLHTMFGSDYCPPPEIMDNLRTYSQPRPALTGWVWSLAAVGEENHQIHSNRSSIPRLKTVPSWRKFPGKLCSHQEVVVLGTFRALRRPSDCRIELNLQNKVRTGKGARITSVSYTHLTLPTICSV